MWLQRTTPRRARNSRANARRIIPSRRLLLSFFLPAASAHGAGPRRVAALAVQAEADRKIHRRKNEDTTGRDEKRALLALCGGDIASRSGCGAANGGATACVPGVVSALAAQRRDLQLGAAASRAGGQLADDAKLRAAPPSHSSPQPTNGPPVDRRPLRLPHRRRRRPATVSSPTNIAVIKYQGRRCRLTTPINSSVSVTINQRTCARRRR